MGGHGICSSLFPSYGGLSQFVSHLYYRLNKELRLDGKIVNMSFDYVIEIFSVIDHAYPLFPPHEEGCL